MRITATITEKGQVTVPKVIRDRIRSRIIEFVTDGDGIQIRGVQSVGGSLAAFSGEYIPLEEVREAVWGAHESD